MRKWSHIILTVLLLVTNVGHGETLNGSPQDLSHAKTIDLLRKVNADGPYALDNSSSKEGGVHSGGGTLVITAQGIGLLDLYLYNRPAFSSSEKGTVLAETKAFRNFGIEHLNRNNPLLLKKTLAQVAVWEKSSPFVTSLLHGSVLSLPLYYVNYGLGYEDQMASVPIESGLQAKDLRLAAFYLADFGAFVDKKSFDRLSEKNQIALIIHEALRHEQLSFKYGLTNESIQKMTAMLLRNPLAGETLDHERFFANGLPKGLERELSLVEGAQIILQEYCRLLESNCGVDPVRLTVTTEALKKFPSSQLSGQELAFRMLDSLLKYRHMRIFKSERERADVQVLLHIIAFQISSLNAKESGNEFHRDAYSSSLNFTKMSQGTDFIDHYLWYYNKGRTLNDLFVMNFEENANVKRFMQEMKAAGYFK